MSQILEVKKEASSKAHKLFRLLQKLELFERYADTAIVYDIWQYAQKVKKK